MTRTLRAKRVVRRAIGLTPPQAGADSRRPRLKAKAAVGRPQGGDYLAAKAIFTRLVNCGTPS